MTKAYYSQKKIIIIIIIIIKNNKERSRLNILVKDRYDQDKWVPINYVLTNQLENNIKKLACLYLELYDTLDLNKQVLFVDSRSQPLIGN